MVIWGGGENTPARKVESNDAIQHLQHAPVLLPCLSIPTGPHTDDMKPISIANKRFYGCYVARLPYPTDHRSFQFFDRSFEIFAPSATERSRAISHVYLFVLKSGGGVYKGISSLVLD